MEETNYSRAVIVGHEAESESTDGSQEVSAKSDEKTVAAAADIEQSEPLPRSNLKQKTYFDKVKLWRTADLRKPNHLAGMVARPVIFLTFPVIFYAGFSYGSNLVWYVRPFPLQRKPKTRSLTEHSRRC